MTINPKYSMPCGLGYIRNLSMKRICRSHKGDKMAKPILCLDFDGVIHSYSSGWKGADVIPDPPVAGAMQFIRDALEHFRVAIFSSRSNQPGGLDAMKDYIALNSEM